MAKEIPVKELTERLSGFSAAVCGRIKLAASRLRMPSEIPQSAVAELLDNLASDLDRDVRRLDMELRQGRAMIKAGERANGSLDDNGR